MFDAISAEWPEVELARIVTIKTGKTPSTKEPSYWGGSISFVTPTDMIDSPYLQGVERSLTPEGVQFSALAPAGAVLFTCIASIGKSCILTEASAFNQQINACIPGPEVDGYFLFHALKARIDQFKALAGTTAVPIVNKTNFGNAQIPVPPLEEQRRIAEVLRSIDDAIAAGQAEANATSKVLGTVRDEVFRKARIDFPEIKVVDALQKNRGEKVSKLQTSAYMEDGKYPIIDQGADFICGYTDDAAALYPYALPVIVFGDHTRALKFVDFPFVIGADGTQCLSAREGILPRYLYFAIQSLELRSEGYARHFKLLKEQSIPLPDVQAQTEIAETLLSLERANEAAISSVKRIEDIRNAVAADLLSGRVRVPA